MKVVWERLIRFVSTDGRVLFGEPILPSPGFDIGNTTEATGLQAKILEGRDPFDESGATKLTDEIATVKELLGPLSPTDVPILRCVGLNYATHIREAGRKPPPFPFIFFKPTTTITDHGADVVIPKIAQDGQADYEGELVSWAPFASWNQLPHAAANDGAKCVVIGKDAKDVSESEALEYVAAYTAGNDVSSRKLQRDPSLAGGVPQWGFSKGFDTYAPLGPVLVSSRLITDPSKLHLQTVVDGEIRQKSGVDDLLFSVPYLISYLSTGTTLQKGSIIMTGTPGGVGAGLTPPKYLVPGTKMEVQISEIGTLRNGVKFA